MKTYLLLWNPLEYTWAEVEKELEEARRLGSAAIPWNISRRSDHQPGDRAFMRRTRSDGGIVGAGWITSTPYTDIHYRKEKAEKGETCTYVKVEFDRLFEHPLIRLDEFNRPPFDKCNVLLKSQNSGNWIREPFATALDNRWSAVAGEALLLENELEEVRAQKEKEGDFTPSDLKDARKRIFAAIVLRQGQGEFRKGLLVAYQQSCAVTGCDVVEALEAAHIVPYLGPKTNCVTNGLLLRADIHTLFDLGLLVVTPGDHRVLISKRLKGSFYQSFAGQQIRLPADDASCPSCQALKARLAEFQCKEAVMLGA